MNEQSPTKVKAERLQTRANTSSEYIDELAERMIAGDVFPPIVIFTDGTDSWLADGIHRLDAAIKAKKKIGVDCRKGTRSEAVEFACGANASHGMRLTPADKRRKVALALSEFPDRSSRAIADLCGVSHTFVESQRSGGNVATPRSTGNVASSNAKAATNGQATKRVGKDGKSRGAKDGISGGTTFDTAEIEAAPESSAPKARNAKPSVSTKQRKECLQLYYKLCRSLQAVGIYDEFIVSLSQIAERLKQI